MDPRERLEDVTVAVKAALDGLRAEIRTTFPGTVVSYDPDAITATVRPAIMSIQLLLDGSTQNVPIPVLLDCPVQWPGGGGASLTFPLKAGDEVVVHIADRCIDGWWQSGGVQPQMEHRLHNLSDGFCVPRVWSQPNKITGVSSTKAQLRSDDGATHVELDPTGQGVTVTAPGGHTINANTTANGAVAATGCVTTSAGVQASLTIAAGADVTSDSGTYSLNTVGAAIPGITSSLTTVAAVAAAAAITASTANVAASTAQTTASAASSSVAGVSSSLGNVSTSLAHVSTSQVSISTSLSTTSSLATAVSTSLAAMPQGGTAANSTGYLGLPQVPIAGGNHTLTLANLGFSLFYSANGNLVVPVHGTLGQTLGSLFEVVADVGVTVTVHVQTDTQRYPTGNLTGDRTVTGPGSIVDKYEKTGEWWVKGGENVT